MVFRTTLQSLWGASQAMTAIGKDLALKFPRCPAPFGAAHPVLVLAGKMARAQERRVL